MPRRLTTFRLLTALLAAASLAVAQQDFSGVVLDPSAAAVPGARITLRPSAGGRARTVTTGDTGGFRFRRLPAGSYQIEATHDGFKPAALAIAVPGGPLSIVLEIADFQQAVSVDTQAAQVTTDPAANLDVVQLDRTALDTLPALDEDIIAAVSHLIDGASVGGGGPTIVVDGMEMGDARLQPSQIQEIRINQNPYSAEFAGEGRGRIEIITNPGTTDYHGRFSFGFRDHHLDARNSFAVQRPAEQRRSYRGTLTGPLGKGRKTSFLAALSHRQEDLESVVYAQTPAGLARQNVPRPDHETEMSFRVNRPFGRNHLISIRYEFADEDQRGSGVGGFRLPEAAFDAANREHHVYYNHRLVLSPRLVHEFQLRSGRHNAVTRSLRPGVPRIVVLDAFTGGGAQSDNHSTENHAQMSGLLSWSRGRHFVKTGVNVPDLSRRGSNDRGDFGGAFTFSTLADYLAGRAFAFQQKQGESRLVFWQKEFGVFVQDDFKLRPNLSLGLGLRYDHQNYLGDHNNLAPRVSFAFSPGRGRRTVLRGGAGFFYEHTGESAIGDTLRYDGRRVRQIVLSSPGYPDPFSRGGGITTLPSSVVRFADDLLAPYRLHHSFTLERQLKKSTTLTASYFGTSGIKLFRSRDANAPLPPFYVRPDPSIGILRQIESSARRESRALEVGVRGDITRFFNGSVRYNLSRAFDDAAGLRSFPADHYDLRGEWGRTDWDERHRFHVMGTLKPGKLFNLGMSLSTHTGRPYNLTTGRDENHDTLALDRPAGVRRNSLQGPGAANLDLRWSREFSLDREKKEKGPVASIGVDAFNVLNRVNYSGYVGNLSSPFFGRPVSSRPARRMQFLLQLKF